MTVHHFTLAFPTLAEWSDRQADDLYEAGCDDCVPVSRDGVASLLFHREAGSLDEAIRSAVKDVQTAGLGQPVGRIEIDPADLTRAG